MHQPDLTDEEIDHICKGKSQNAAKVRHLKAMGLCVRQKPNGQPLVNRAHYDAVTSSSNATTESAGPTQEPAWEVHL